MTWEITGTFALFALVVAVGGLGYFAWASRELDRRYGKPNRPDPAE